MFTVALVGADGAGKSTIGRRVVDASTVPMKYMYMGDNPAATTHTLSAVRLLRRARGSGGAAPRPGGPPDPHRRAARRPRGRIRAALRLLDRLLDEWFRQGVAWYYCRRGYVVLFDRHFFADYYAHHIEPGGERLPLSDRLHGLVLAHLYPRPDLIVCLDAPAEVLFARKSEGSLEAVERRRREYAALRDHVRHFAVVDATRTVDEVARAVTTIIHDFPAGGGGIATVVESAS